MLGASGISWKLRTGLLLAGAVACLFAGAYLSLLVSQKLNGLGSSPPRQPAVVKVTAQMLHSEDLMFLVTNRIVTQVMVEQNQDSIWAGKRDGVLIAQVRLYYGVDLNKITDADIHDQAGQVVITLPAPQILDFAIDPNYKVITKRSGMQVALDWVYGQNLEAELRSHIQEQALEFAKFNGLLPTPAQVIRRLNQTADLLSAKVNKPVIFSFSKPATTQVATSQPAGG